LTHYHTTYFPVLVFVGLLGFVQFANSFRRLGKYGIATVLGVLTVLNIYIVTTMVPGIKNLDRPLTSYLSVLGGIGKLYDGQYEYYQSLMKVRDHIPVNSKVVTTEHALPIIGLQSEVSLVPLGLADADYAFLPVIREPHQGIGMRIGGSSSYLGEKDTMSQDDCISQHLETYGYDMGNIKRFGSWALLKRNK